jgi:hypothetical protein
MATMPALTPLAALAIVVAIVTAACASVDVGHVKFYVDGSWNAKNLHLM